MKRVSNAYFQKHVRKFFTEYVCNAHSQMHGCVKIGI